MCSQKTAHDNKPDGWRLLPIAKSPKRLVDRHSKAPWSVVAHRFVFGRMCRGGAISCGMAKRGACRPPARLPQDRDPLERCSPVPTRVPTRWLRTNGLGTSIGGRRRRGRRDVKARSNRLTKSWKTPRSTQCAKPGPGQTNLLYPVSGRCVQNPSPDSIASKPTVWSSVCIDQSKGGCACLDFLDPITCSQSRA